MFGLTTVAVENLIASYKARFRPNPDGEGYLFNKDDYGTGVSCSTEQYNNYAYEFEQFVTRKNRFMWFWLFLVLILFAATYGFILFKYGQGILDNKGDLIKISMGILIVSPLAFIIKQGWDIFQRPVRELADNGNPVRQKQDRGEITKRRLKGMSSAIIVMGLGISSIGLYFSFCEILGLGCIKGVESYSSPYMKYYFGAIFIAFILLGWGKYRAHKEDTRVLRQQANKLELKHEQSSKNTQQAYLQLADLALYHNDPTQLKQEITAVPFYEPDNWHGSYEFSYNDAIMEVLEENSLLLLYMDWKEAVDDYFLKINKALGEHSKSVILPDVNKYPDNASLGYKGVFSETATALHQAGFEICYVNTGSDSYHALLFEQANHDKVAAAMYNIQLPFTFGTP